MKGRQSGNQAMLGWVEIDGMDGIKGPHTQATQFVGQNQGKMQKTRKQAFTKVPCSW